MVENTQPVVDITAGTSEMYEVSNQLNSLATDIDTTLSDIQSVVSIVAEGAIYGSAADSFIAEYEELHNTLVTYPQRLNEMANTLSKATEGYQNVNASAGSAVTGA